MSRTINPKSTVERMNKVYKALLEGKKTMQQINDVTGKKISVTSWMVNRLINHNEYKVLSHDGAKDKSARLYQVVDGITEQIFNDAVVEMYLSTPKRMKKGITRDVISSVQEAQVQRIAAAKKTIVSNVKE